MVNNNHSTPGIRALHPPEAIRPRLAHRHFFKGEVMREKREQENDIR
jgi:hypothetical protein